MFYENKLNQKMLLLMPQKMLPLMPQLMPQKKVSRASSTKPLRGSASSRGAATLTRRGGSRS